MIGLQFVITWLSVRFEAIDALAKSEPTLLVREGALLEAALRQQRVTPDEVRAAVRGAGLPGPEAAEAVILETDGSMSVITRNRG